MWQGGGATRVIKTSWDVGPRWRHMESGSHCTEGITQATPALKVTWNGKIKTCIVIKKNMVGTVNLLESVDWNTVKKLNDNLVRCSIKPLCECRMDYNQILTCEFPGKSYYSNVNPYNIHAWILALRYAITGWNVNLNKKNVVENKDVSNASEWVQVYYEYASVKFVFRNQYYHHKAHSFVLKLAIKLELLLTLNSRVW